MKQQICFAVLGDMHYVQPECHKKALGGQPGGVTEIVDITRNFWMTQNVLPGIFSLVSSLNPDFIIQTGDYIQGHCDDVTACLRENAEALELLNGMNTPLYFAMGTHDVIPGVNNGSGKYYSFVKENSLFVVLDYTTFKNNDAQIAFIEDTLNKAESYDHVFVFAHPPLVPVGRPFFTDYDFIKKIEEVVKKHPIDGYFCGHTHNQVASIHKIGDYWIPQFKSSILGYPDECPIKLEDTRPILPDPDAFELGWGFLEDSAPGFWLVTVNGARVNVEWHVLGMGVQGEIVWDRGEKPHFKKLPVSMCDKTVKTLDTKQIQSIKIFDIGKIKSARIRAAGSNCKPDECRVFLNERLLGYLPQLEYFDCRQFFTIDASVWPLLKSCNTLKVTAPLETACLGGFTIELETESGWLRSNVSTFFTNTTKWDKWQVNEHIIKHVTAGSEIEVELYFTDSL